MALMNPVFNHVLFNTANVKDSRWLTLDVCREWTRNKCPRADDECRFAHPPANVDIQNGRVTCCFDSIKGKCQRQDPPCKYLHPPQHLKEQLLQNGRNNLIARHLQMQALAGALPGLYPVTHQYLVHNGTTFNPYYAQTGYQSVPSPGTAVSFAQSASPGTGLPTGGIQSVAVQSSAAGGPEMGVPSDGVCPSSSTMSSCQLVPVTLYASTGRQFGANQHSGHPENQVPTVSINNNNNYVNNNNNDDDEDMMTTTSFTNYYNNTYNQMIHACHPPPVPLAPWPTNIPPPTTTIPSSSTTYCQLPPPPLYYQPTSTPMAPGVLSAVPVLKTNCSGAVSDKGATIPFGYQQATYAYQPSAIQLHQPTAYVPLTYACHPITPKY